MRWQRGFFRQIEQRRYQDPNQRHYVSVTICGSSVCALCAFVSLGGFGGFGFHCVVWFLWLPSPTFPLFVDVIGLNWLGALDWTSVQDHIKNKTAYVCLRTDESFDTGSLLLIDLLINESMNTMSNKSPSATISTVCVAEWVYPI